MIYIYISQLSYHLGASPCSIWERPRHGWKIRKNRGKYGKTVPFPVGFKLLQWGQHKYQEKWTCKSLRKIIIIFILMLWMNMSFADLENHNSHSIVRGQVLTGVLPHRDVHGNHGNQTIVESATQLSSSQIVVVSCDSWGHFSKITPTWLTVGHDEWWF